MGRLVGVTISAFRESGRTIVLLLPTYLQRTSLRHKFQAHEFLAPLARHLRRYCAKHGWTLRARLVLSAPGFPTPACGRAWLARIRDMAWWVWNWGFFRFELSAVRENYTISWGEAVCMRKSSWQMH